jgi:hypothetical protein
MLAVREMVMARRIFGKIESEWGIPPEVKMRVRVWDADIDNDDHIGTTGVNKDGSYCIEFTDDKWDWTPIPFLTKWRPDVYIVVEIFDEISELWKEIERSKVYSDLDVREDQEINLFVNYSYTNSNSIYGYIKTREGKPLSEITVSAWDEKYSLYGSQVNQSQDSIEVVDDDSSVFIGSSVTNDKGAYRILFDPAKFAITLEKVLQKGLDAMRRPDIFIKVHNLEGDGVMYRSPTKQNMICQLGCRIDAKL